MSKKMFRQALIIGALCLASSSINAAVDWVSITIDNDTFVGNDNGYTNGIFLSTYDVGEDAAQMPTPDFWVRPLLWSLPLGDAQDAVNSYTVGQVMSTPSDISIEVPDEDELPYSALLFLTNSYIAANAKYADKVSVTIGVVGPVAYGEQTQKFVHDLIGATEPQGWNTQISNELVFRLSRARVWRAWVSGSGNADLLTQGELGLGTIESSISTGLMFRYGRSLSDSYASTLLNRSRTSNPVAIEGGWYVYVGVSVDYTFNQIFTDGNTFRDSRSIDYDKSGIGATAGIAYASKNYSLTFAINDLDILSSDEQSDKFNELTQFGTLTFASKW